MAERYRPRTDRIPVTGCLPERPGSAGMGGIATLILLNGPPAVGKSLLARRHAGRHPLTLVVEIDAIRLSLGGWAEHDESKRLARSLATAMAETHLRAGYDVVVPQYLGRTDFIEVLDRLAHRLGAAFAEFLLLDAPATIIERFRVRRAELAAAGRAHPEREIGDDVIAERIADACDRLRAVARARPRTRLLDAAAGIDAGCRALEQARTRSDRPMS